MQKQKLTDEGRRKYPEIGYVFEFGSSMWCSPIPHKKVWLGAVFTCTCQAQGSAELRRYSSHAPRWITANGVYAPSTCLHPGATTERLRGCRTGLLQNAIPGNCLDAETFALKYRDVIVYIEVRRPVSYTHLTLPTTPYV